MLFLECYVSDEIITARSGKRIRVGNTDAEGRMVMVDLLCEAKEAALKETNPQLFTIATLTGHVIRAYGPNYSVGNFKINSSNQRILRIDRKSCFRLYFATVRLVILTSTSISRQLAI